MSAPAPPAGYTWRGRDKQGNSPALAVKFAIKKNHRLTFATRALGVEITAAMDGQGELHAEVDRRVLMSRAGVTHATFARSLKALIEAGYVEREYVAIQRGTQWVRCLVIRLAEAYRWRPAAEAKRNPARPRPRPKPAPEPAPEPQAPDLPEYHSASPAPPGRGFDRVRAPIVTSADRIARAREAEDTPEQRAEIRAAWPRLARSRSDVPMLRPGYADRYTVRNETCMGCGKRGHVRAWCPERTLVIIDELPY